MDFNTVVLSLISGLIGAILGSVISSIATFYITRYSLRESTKNALLVAKKQKKDDSDEQIKKAKHAIITELFENADCIILNKTHKSKFRFNADAWSIYKPYLSYFPDDTGKLLLFAYSEIKRYNTLIDYDVNITPGLGLLDAQIEAQEAKVAKAIDDAKNQLGTHVNKL